MGVNIYLVKRGTTGWALGGVGVNIYLVKRGTTGWAYGWGGGKSERTIENGKWKVENY